MTTADKKPGTHKPEFNGEWVKLGDLCGVCSGGTPKRSVSEYWNEGSIPWVKISDISGKFVSSTEELITEAGLKGSSAKLLAPGTLLYSIFASIGAVGILKIPAATNQAIAGLSIKTDRIERDYLYHFLKSRESLAKSSGRGVAQNNINLTILRGMEVPVPAIGEQKAIVEQLEIIATQIKQAETQLDQLDSLVKSQFVEMFGDPIEVIDGIALGSIALLKAGETTTSSSISNEMHDGLYPCYGGNGLRGFTAEYTHDGSYPLIGRQGALCGNVRMAVGKFKATEHAVVVQPSIEINRVWLFHYLRYDNLARLATGAAQPGLSVKNLNKVPVALPPLDLQRRFADFVAQVDKLGFDSCGDAFSACRLLLVKGLAGGVQDGEGPSRRGSVHKDEGGK